MVTPQQHNTSTTLTPTPCQGVTQGQGLDGTAWERMARHCPGSFWVMALGTAPRFGQALGMVLLEGDFTTSPNYC